MSEEQVLLLRDKQLPSCIEYVLGNVTENIGEANYNKLLFQVIIPYFRDADYTQEEAWEISQNWVEDYTGSATYNTFEKRRAEWQKMWHYLDNSDAYLFGCSYVLGLKLPSKSFNCSECPCNPDRKPSFKEFRKKIQQTDDFEDLTIDIIKEIANSGLANPVKTD